MKYLNTTIRNFTHTHTKRNKQKKNDKTTKYLKLSLPVLHMFFQSNELMSYVLKHFICVCVLLCYNTERHLLSVSSYLCFVFFFCTFFHFVTVWMYMYVWGVFIHRSLFYFIFLFSLSHSLLFSCHQPHFVRDIFVYLFFHYLYILYLGT